MKATLNKAIKVWGEQSQLIKANEELAELQQAICKWMLKDVEKRHLEVNLYLDVINEIADVEIMLAQLKLILAIPEQHIKERKREKILRMEGYLESF